MMTFIPIGDEVVCYYIGERLKLEGETENVGRLNEEAERLDGSGTPGHSRPRVTGSGGHKHRGGEGRKLCWKFATVSWSERAAVGSGRPSARENVGLF